MQTIHLSRTRNNIITGFSLIEIMVVVTIIGILITLALPSYQNYTARARFVEIISTTHIFKTAITLALQQGIPLEEITSNLHGIPPLPHPTKNLAQLIIEHGKIIATGSNLVKNATYILTPNFDGSEWKISGSCLKLGYCQTT